MVRHGARCSETSSSSVSTFLSRLGQPLHVDSLYGTLFGQLMDK